MHTHTEIEGEWGKQLDWWRDEKVISFFIPNQLGMISAASTWIPTWQTENEERLVFPLTTRKLELGGCYLDFKALILSELASLGWLWLSFLLPVIWWLLSLDNKAKSFLDFHGPQHIFTFALSPEWCHMATPHFKESWKSILLFQSE